MTDRSLVNRVARAIHNIPVYIPNSGSHSENDAFNRYGRGMTWAEFKIVIDKADELAARFYDYKYYRVEIYPRWQFVERINWADNSIERLEYSPVLDKHRTVREEAPHGDNCY